MYRKMHEEGDPLNALNADQTFDGSFIKPHIQTIGRFIKGSHSKSLLDYGCGKARIYQQPKDLKTLWGLDEIQLYDPGCEPYQAYPSGQYDAVISTDVLEHITKKDMDWVLADILGFARKLVFLNIACYPAQKTRPNGENAHITQENPGWWLDMIHGVKRTNPQIPNVFLIIADEDRKLVIVEL